MLIYKQKQTNDGKQWYTKALKVGNTAWLQDSFEELNKKDDSSWPYSKYLTPASATCIDVADINNYHAPNLENIKELNAWLNIEGNLQTFKDFYHIVKDNDIFDNFWVEGEYLTEIASLKDGQIKLQCASVEGNWDKTNNILINQTALALPHLVISIDECEEIPD